ncbi:hypothetical protein [Paucibacter soli]|uniref:hypothetical protein n=1 Tax=Paucibacter soli TaxID=3133433 RepID=UPI0030B69245
MNTMTATAAAACAHEMQIVQEALTELQTLATTEPKFYARLDDTDLDSCPRGELVSLLADAPNAAARQYVFSKYTSRVALASIAGRPFC